MGIERFQTAAVIDNNRLAGEGGFPDIYDFPGQAGGSGIIRRDTEIYPLVNIGSLGSGKNDITAKTMPHGTAMGRYKHFIVHPVKLLALISEGVFKHIVEFFQGSFIAVRVNLSKRKIGVCRCGFPNRNIECQFLINATIRKSKGVLAGTIILFDTVQRKRHQSVIISTIFKKRSSS